MIESTEICYQGNNLEVLYKYTKGRGNLGRELPYEKDEVEIINIVTLDDSSEVPNLSDTGTRWDIERMILEKI